VIEIDTAKSSLALAVPSYDGKMMVDVIGPIIKLSLICYQNKNPLTFIYQAGNALIDYARNLIVDDFLKQTNMQKLLFVDSDIIFTEADVLRLLAWGQKYLVVGATYPCKMDEPRFFLKSRETLNNEALAFNEDQLIEVSGFGAGFLMIDRSVFEKLQSVVPHIVSHDREYHAYFLNTVENHIYRGEDISFLELCVRNGIQPVLDWEIALQHVGRKAYDHKLSDLLLRDGIIQVVKE